MLTWSMAALAADPPEPPVVGGVVQPTVTVDLPDDSAVPEDEITADTWMRAFASGKFANHDRWFLEARVQHHLAYGPKQIPGQATEGWWDVGLGESGWDGKIGGPVRGRFGVLTERWGTLDLLPVSDVLNPRDGRSGPGIPGEFLKIPVP